MMRTVVIALGLTLVVVAPAAAGTVDELLGALNLVPLNGVVPPSFALERLEDGKTVALSSLRGRPVLIYFWATW